MLCKMRRDIVNLSGREKNSAVEYIRQSALPHWIRETFVHIFFKYPHHTGKDDTWVKIIDDLQSLHRKAKGENE